MSNCFSFFVWLLVVGLGLSSVAGQICSGCKITPASVRNARIANAEEALILSDAQKAAIRDEHVPWGLPRAPATAANERVLYQTEWLTWYDDDLRVPLWVAYKLKGEDADAQRPRLDCFRHDARLAVLAMSGCNDYRTSGFDRGHMVPADDLKRSETSIDNSFLFSNMNPQLPNFNQIVWQRLESKVNGWAIEAGHVYVITGAIFDRDGDGERDADEDARTFSPKKRVALATHFYKIIIHERSDRVIDTISFVLPHNNRKNTKDTYYKSKITTIDAIEARTGIDFSPEMEDEREDAIEAGKAKGLGTWFTF